MTDSRISDRPLSGLAAIAASGAGAFAALAGLAWLPPLQLAASVALAAAMGAIAATDLRRQQVPDVWNLFAALGGFAAITLHAAVQRLDPFPALTQALVGMALCGGALYLCREAFYRLRGIDGLGLGDVKLGVTGGIWLGWELFSIAILLASLGALAFILARTALDGSWPRDRKLPFALYLGPAIWLCWFAAQALPPA